MGPRWLPPVVVVVFLFLVGGSINLIPKLQFDYDFEQFFPAKDPDLDFYQRFRELFEPDDNYVLVAIENKEGVFSRTFLQRFSALTEDCANLPFITQSTSLTNYRVLKSAAGYLYAQPAVHIDEPSRYSRDSIRLMSDRRLVNGLVSNDGKALCLVLKTDGVLDLPKSQRLHHALDSMLLKHAFTDGHIAGRAYYQSLFEEKEREEFSLYTITAAVLIVLTVFLLFGRIWPVIISIVSVSFGMVLFLGFLSISKTTLDPMSTLFPILMGIVGTSDVVHLMSKYIIELRRGKTKREAIRVTIREVGLATLLTSVTTAVGFLSLYTANVIPIKKFGVTAAIGVFIAFFTVILFTTAALHYLGRKQLARKEKKENFWSRLMRFVFNFTRTNTKAIGWSAVVLVGVCLIGISQISTNVTLDKQFPRKDKVKADFRFFEDRFGGMRPFEIAASAQGDLTLDSNRVIREIGKFEDYLLDETPLASITSPASIYKDLNRAFNGDRAEAHTLPESDQRMSYYRGLITRAPGQVTKTIISSDRKHGRISSRFRDMGTTNSMLLKEEINDWITQNTDSTIMTLRVAGSSLLFDKNNEYVRRSIFYGLGLAFIVISILMGALFRNLKMVLISLVPNVLPILMCGALVGFLGIELSAATSIIFAIAFGIAVDDTIHFLSRFRIERAKGLPIAEAVHNCYLETGKAICMTTVILFCGFIILVTSTYPNTVTIGLLTSLTLASALVADLLLTPVLIYWLIKDK